MTPNLFNPYRFVSGSAIGGWKELDRDTLTGTSDTITLSSLSNKPYLLNLGFFVSSGNTNPSLRMGNGSIDTGTNYSWRKSLNFGTDSTGVSQNEIISDTVSTGMEYFTTSYLHNYTSTEKMIINYNVSSDGSTTSTETTCNEVTGKWSDTSNVIDEFQIYNSSTGDFGANSETLLLEYDGADADTGGVFEELATSGAASGSDLELDSGTFTAKKFLFYEVANNGNSTGESKQFRFNSDSGTNYCWRGQENGGTTTAKAQNATRIGLDQNNNTAVFGFIYNNNDYVKLGQSWGIKQGSSGATSSPAQSLYSFKWVNTSSQITSIQLRAEGTANIGAGTTLKVWGTD